MNETIERLLNTVPDTSSMYATSGSLDVYVGGLFRSYSRPLNDNGSGDLPMDGPAPMDGPGQMTNRYGPLVERIDLSGHGGSGPHLNYDIYGSKGSFGRNALGPNHKMDLFDK